MQYGKKNGFGLKTIVNNIKLTIIGCALQYKLYSFKKWISAFYWNCFAIKLADSKGWLKESETTPVMVFLEIGGQGD